MSKVKVTASHIYFFFTFLNFHFWPFLPCIKLRVHRNTPTATRLSLRLSVSSFTTFQVSAHLLTNHLKEMTKFGMLVYPDDLPWADIDADGYCFHFMRSSVRPTLREFRFWHCMWTYLLEEKVNILACWCIQMTYPELMGVRPFVHHIFRFLCICWQITWKEWVGRGRGLFWGSGHPQPCGRVL